MSPIPSGPLLSEWTRLHDEDALFHDQMPAPGKLMIASAQPSPVMSPVTICVPFNVCIWDHVLWLLFQKTQMP